MLLESVKQLVPRGSLRHPCSETANSNTILGCGNKMIHALKIRHNFDNSLRMVISFWKAGRRALTFNNSMLEEVLQSSISLSFQALINSTFFLNSGIHVC